MRQWRQFYVESMWRPALIDEPLWRLATYDSITSERLSYLGSSVFTESERKSQLVTDLLDVWNKQLTESKDTRIIGVEPWNNQG